MKWFYLACLTICVGSAALAAADETKEPEDCPGIDISAREWVCCVLLPQLCDLDDHFSDFIDGRHPLLP